MVLWPDWLVFCDYGFSVSALWCPLSTPTILFGFLLSWTWGMTSQLLQQSADAAPYFGYGVAPLSRSPWNLENSAVAMEKVSFHSNPKECSKYSTIALISQASKVMLNILQARLQQYVSCELPDVQAGFRKGRGTRDKLPTSTGSSKSKRVP